MATRQITDWSDVTSAAEALAGNWRGFGSFAWHRAYKLDDADKWAVDYTWAAGKPSRRAWEDLRRPATRAIRRQGFSYLVTPPRNVDLGEFSQNFIGHEAEWGLEEAGYAGDFHLFRVK